jgi:epsilon-lactone hydrolase
VKISGSAVLKDAVLKALNLSEKELLHMPAEAESRVLEGEWIENAVDSKDNNSPIILYLHGGAHIFMSPNTHRGITSEAAKSCNAKIFALDYRLAPESPFPSAVVDSLAAYLALVQPDAVIGSNCSLNTKVFSNHRIFLMGDSSGCSLILQLLQTLKEMNLPMPAGACLISPFVNNELSGKSWQSNWNSDFVSLGNINTYFRYGWSNRNFLTLGSLGNSNVF